MTAWKLSKNVAEPIHKCEACGRLQFYKARACACGSERFSLTMGAVPRANEDRGGAMGTLCRIAVELPAILALVLTSFIVLNLLP